MNDVRQDSHDDMHEQLRFPECNVRGIVQLVAERCNSLRPVASMLLPAASAPSICGETRYICTSPPAGRAWWNAPSVRIRAESTFVNMDVSSGTVSPVA